jgi:hypothetical protein
VKTNQAGPRMYKLLASGEFIKIYITSSRRKERVVRSPYRSEAWTVEKRWLSESAGACLSRLWLYIRGVFRALCEFLFERNLGILSEDFEIEPLYVWE